MMKSLICLSFILLSLISITEGFHGKSVRNRDVWSPKIKEAAKYAIDEHNSESNDNLVLVRIVQGKMQVHSAIVYDLIIEAKDESGVTKNYKAVVMESERDKILYSFNAV
ncbi:unnamed protein product [Eruca vesicaria subsp. sativa]|uniref:Cystatin domain-containing protein n=1 Tax=Eruca vesicaria subsp. sativa TaxID=29727 RepID=A0ABC8J835_ERUVS|nr:unnamed protein product [Eruca vesicaria subsp. sativa]